MLSSREDGFDVWFKAGDGVRSQPEARIPWVLP